MKRKSIMWFSSLAVMLTIVFVFGCNKKFDEPPGVIDPGVTANMTIKQLKDLNAPGTGAFKLLSGNMIIRGVVVGNDRTGNIYKTLYIQDETGGIMIELNATGLYNSYPVGREIFILCDGLYMANETSMIKLCMRTVVNGVPSATGIPGILIDKYIRRGSINNPVIPKVLTLSQLTNAYQSMLVKLENFELQGTTAADLNKIYADTSVNKATTNVNFKLCGGGTSDVIIVRTSAYASFAATRIPPGKGSITAVYTTFGTVPVKQLIIRDTSDLQMGLTRCDGSTPTPPGPLNIVGIKQIRALYGTANPVVALNTGIEGVIVSNTLNEAAGNYRIQGADGYGIQLRFTTAGNPNASVGDKLRVDVSGLPVELFNGDMQLNNVSSSTNIGAGTVVPRVTTTAAITANIAASNTDNWASTVATLSNVTIAAGAPGSTGTNYTLTDASGSMVSFVRTSLGYTMPASASSVTGYISVFNGTPQLTIRSSADVVATVSPLPTVTTNAVTAVAQTTATSGGNVTAPGTSAVTARGVIWSTSPAPLVTLSTKTTDGTGVGAFTSAITGLAAGTMYYVRAYATNANGTAYGNDVTFTTGSSSGTTTTEDFETGNKTSYTAGSTPLSTGSWYFSDALIGTTTGSDIFNGAKSARVRGGSGSNNGYILTEFGFNGLKKVTVSHAQTNFNEGTGTLTPSFELYISKDAGTTWTKVGATTASIKGAFTTTSFNITSTATENVRVKILNTSNAAPASTTTPPAQVRLNIDDVKFEY